ncbi:hypothetical protein KAU92_06485, partial [Candidatus Bathyarchaeota archaeon]|nr:hypothetical protein [Candidatus Bathyarchaeota archaeon]
SVKEALEALEGKEETTKAIFKKLYGFSLGEDFTPFHLILDTSNLNKEEVFRILCMTLENVVLKPSKLHA